MNIEEKSASKENKNNINEMRTKLPNFKIVHPFLFPRLKLPEASVEIKLQSERSFTLPECSRIFL